MKVLIIGTGSIGRRHLANLSRLLPDMEVVIWRPGRPGADDRSRELGATVVADLDQARPFDLAVVANPSALHAQALLELIPLKVPLYLEKPLVTDAGQLEAVARCIRDHGYDAPSLSGCNLRFLPSLQRLKAAIDDGMAGEICRVSMQVGQWLPDWRPGTDYRQSYSADPARGGGVVFDLVHELDAARWLFGEMSALQALAGHSHELGVASESQALINMRADRDSALVAVGMDYIARPPVRRYEIYGSRGTLVWDLFERRLAFHDGTGGHSLSDASDDFDVPGTYTTAMRELLDAINNGGPTSQGIDEAMASARLAIQVKEVI